MTVQEIEKLLFDKFGFTQVDVDVGDWKALRLQECATAIHEAMEKEIDNLETEYRCNIADEVNKAIAIKRSEIQPIVEGLIYYAIDPDFHK